ncbi:MAG: 1-hydroxycarotenoid 3,4-desaturase CrtD [Pseudomonadota bacterium]
MATNSKRRRVIVVGGGVAGLVSTLELAAQGFEVTLLERANQVGGKMRQVRIDDQGIDVGPTVLTMRWAFENVFADVGEKLDEHLKLVPAEVLARHAWQDGGRLDLYTDPERSARAIQDFAGKKEAEGFRKFSAYAKKIYEATEEPFILAQRPDFLAMVGSLGLSGMAKLTRIDMLRSMWKSLGDFFKDPHLHQLFARYATYYGSSPYMAPATLNLIAHVELQGVWFVDGGMVRIAETFEALARARGAEIRTGVHVDRLLMRGDRVQGVVTAQGETLQADAVIVNADVAALATGKLGSELTGSFNAPELKERSLSALTLAMRARTSGLDLMRHTVFFSRDYKDEFERIFDQQLLPREPTTYICAQDRLDDGATITGPERLFFIINAPAVGDRRRFDDKEIQACLQATFAMLERCGLKLERDPAATVVTTPHDFEQSFPATGGALYGSATHSWKGPLNRPAGRTKVPGLYLAGGSVHPGAGVPMVTLGGRLAAAAVLEDLASTSLSPLRVTRGGTSTV